MVLVYIASCDVGMEPRTCEPACFFFVFCSRVHRFWVLFWDHRVWRYDSSNSAELGRKGRFVLCEGPLLWDAFVGENMRLNTIPFWRSHLEIR